MRYLLTISLALAGCATVGAPRPVYTARIAQVTAPAITQPPAAAASNPQ